MAAARLRGASPEDTALAGRHDPDGVTVHGKLGDGADGGLAGPNRGDRVRRPHEDERQDEEGSEPSKHASP